MIKVNKIDSKIFQMTLQNGYQIIYDHNTYTFGVQDTDGNVVEGHELAQGKFITADTVCANFEVLSLKYQDAI